MTEEQRLNAYIQELAAQRNAIGDRALMLAAQVAEEQLKVKELEAKLVELAKGESNVVDLPPRPAA